MIDSTGVTLNWNPPPMANINGVVRHYIITATEANTGDEYEWDSVTTSIEIHSLHPFYIYHFQVAAFTVGLGPFSREINLQTLQDGECTCIFFIHT